MLFNTISVAFITQQGLSRKHYTYHTAYARKIPEGSVVVAPTFEGEKLAVVMANQGTAEYKNVKNHKVVDKVVALVDPTKTQGPLTFHYGYSAKELKPRVLNYLVFAIPYSNAGRMQKLGLRYVEGEYKNPVEAFKALTKLSVTERNTDMGVIYECGDSHFLQFIEQPSIKAL
jgi:hypothetical protein